MDFSNFRSLAYAEGICVLMGIWVQVLSGSSQKSLGARLSQIKTFQPAPEILNSARDLDFQDNAT